MVNKSDSQWVSAWLIQTKDVISVHYQKHLAKQKILLPNPMD